MIFPWPPVLVENILKILVEAQNNSESHCVYKTTYSYTHNAVVSVRSFNSLQTVQKVFLIKTSFAVTISKAQGQTFKQAATYPPSTASSMWHFPYPLHLTTSLLQ